MFLWKETKSIKRVSKAGNLDKERISTPMTNDKKKDVKTSKNKLKRERKKAAKKLPSSPVLATTQVTSTNYCLRKLKKSLKLSPLDCSFGAKCRYLHTTPTTANKAEIQGVIENAAHPGSLTEKKSISDALALL